MKQRFYALCVLAMLFGGGLLAQPESWTVRFRAGDYTPTANTDEFFQGSPRQSELLDGKYYRYLQFQSPPSAAQRSELAGLGIDLLSYVPPFTYLAAIDQAVNRRDLAAFDLRSAFTVPAYTVLDPRLADGEYPDWAWDGNALQLVVQFPENLNPRFVAQALTIAGFRVLGIVPNDNELNVSVDPARLEELAAHPAIVWVEAIAEPGKPEDLRALGLHRSNVVSSDHPMGRHYNGAGVNVMVRDDGGVGPHIDFEGRTNQIFSPNNGGTHGDMVAGVFGGAGNLDPTTRGAAWGSFFYILDYESTFTDNTLSLHQNSGVMITNSSYSNGCNAGYTTTTQRVDNQIFNNPSLLHMFSGGNSNNNNCGYGAGTQWGNITGGHKVGKNVMAVANLLPDGTLVNSSSRGPAHDGRIKPDVAANGNEQMSTDPGNAYAPGGGTSAASPSTAGVIAQLYQAYKELIGNGNNPPSALIKAIVMNTAEDYGNRGPDYKYGWGRINAYRAVRVLEDGRFLSDNVAQGATNLHSIEVPAGTRSVKVMTYWSEPAAFPGASIALINDLDSRLLDPAGGATLPWVLNPAANALSLDLPALRGPDRLNNVEQVQIDNPVAGTYQLEVKGYGLGQGPQEYFVVYEFITDEIAVTHPIGGEGFTPGETVRVHWDAEGDFGPFTLQYSTDSGQNWSLIAANVPGGQRFYDWTTPQTVSGKYLVRVRRGNEVATSPYAFTLIGTPQSLEVTQVCNNSMTLVWDAVDGAVAYDVFQLGSQYMDSVTTTTETNVRISIPNAFTEYWVSVRARSADGTAGRRANAVASFPISYNCNSIKDVTVRSIPSLAGGTVPSCADTLRVTLELMNMSSEPQSNFSVGYQFAGQAAVIDTFQDTLAPGATALLALGGGYAPAVGQSATIDIKAFTGLIGDLFPGNDTLYQSISIVNYNGNAAPFTETLEFFPNCGTNSDCGTTICALGSGWTNEQNSVIDDIDWRTDAGGTPSSGTGPERDRNPGNSLGNYLYLESSNGCNDQTAILSSPCVFIGSLTKPRLTFWYHMWGGSMGSLAVDVFDGSAWHPGVWQISGDRGNQWHEASIDLSMITGNFCQFRIRGTTGNGFTSDIAIDDISVTEAAKEPEANFSASRTQVCPGIPIALIDESGFEPDSLSWQLSPATHSFEAGSHAQSASPMVSFQEEGTYDVTLIASNVYGSDTLTKTLYVTSSQGATLPFSEDFEAGPFPPTNWYRENADGNLTWQSAFVQGPAGSFTVAAQVDNYNYDANGEEDLLATQSLDLRTAIAPQLSFDLAYAAYNINAYDGLRILISDNCGQSYLVPVYDKVGSTLATVPAQTGVFIPSAAQQWRRDTVDLSDFVGQVISIGFVNLNGHGNQLYLDNVMVEDLMQVAPVADITAPPSQYCVGEAILISDLSTGNNLAYSWSTDSDAEQANLVGAGDQFVTYTTPGPKELILTVSNPAGSASDTLYFDILPATEADFNFDISGGFQTYVFENLSAGADSYSWDFGDGTTSSDSLPTHTYTVNGSYDVVLIASGPCGFDTSTQTILINNVAIDGELGGLNFQAYPNPAEHQLWVALEGEQPGEVRMQLLDLRGKAVQQARWQYLPGQRPQQIDLQPLPAGVYLLQLQFQDRQGSYRLMIQ